MNDYLKVLNLIQEINIELQISKSDFTKKFKENVDEPNLGFEPFEMFSSSKNNYKGNIGNTGFELEKRWKLFNPSYFITKATGIFTEETDRLTTKITIELQKKIFFFMGILALFYITSLTGFLYIDDISVLFAMLPFILLYTALLLGIPYFIIKLSVKKMVSDLEKDFNYWFTK